MLNVYEVIIIGGGLAGLVAAIQLGEAGFRVLLIEKKQYPFHRVCGEYISNETLPFLQSLKIDPAALGASRITQLQITSTKGYASLQMPLDLGGFGLSRYTFDYHLYQKAEQAGVTCITGKSVEQVQFAEDVFTVQLSDASLEHASLVVGAFGKRSRLDKQLNRTFMQERSPYIGVKYHVRIRFPRNLIALHNFRDGYCGVCAIENETYNLCYLTTRDNLKKYGSIEEMEANTLYHNLHMKTLRNEMEFVYTKPEVINEISFSPKKAVEHHILMIGDTAGLITPLCGNGMAMAIHSAKLLADLIVQYRRENQSRAWLEDTYTRQWQRLFARRLWVGRHIQRLFGKEFISSLSIRLLQSFGPLARYVVSQTHGQPF